MPLFTQKTAATNAAAESRSASLPVNWSPAIYWSSAKVNVSVEPAYHMPSITLVWKW